MIEKIFGEFQTRLSVMKFTFFNLTFKFIFSIGELYLSHIKDFYEAGGGNLQ